MQQTVFDQEDAKWQRDVLTDATAPEKPQQKAPKTKKSADEALKDGEQDGASSSGEGSMADFIDDDGDEVDILAEETTVTGARYAATLPAAGTVDKAVDSKTGKRSSFPSPPHPVSFLPSRSNFHSRNMSLLNAYPRSDMLTPRYKQQMQPRKPPNLNWVAYSLAGNQ